MLCKAIGLMKVLKKIAKTPEIQVTVKPLERSWYGQISQGYDTRKGVLRCVRTAISTISGNLQCDIITSKENEQKWDDSSASRRSSSLCKGAGKSSDDDKAETHRCSRREE